MKANRPVSAFFNDFPRPLGVVEATAIDRRAAKATVRFLADCGADPRDVDAACIAAIVKLFTPERKVKP